MILKVAHNVSTETADHASRFVLLTGLEIEPFSSKIRSDLVCDTWAVAAESDDPADLLLTISVLVSGTALATILPGAKECICDYGLCAVLKLDQDPNEIEMYLEQFAYCECRDVRIESQDNSLA